MVTLKKQTLVDRANGRCKFCSSSRIVRNGTRKSTQYWLCKDCGRGFVDNHALPKMKFAMDTVALAVCQYYSGVSLKEIRDRIDEDSNIRPDYSAIYDWITRLTRIAQNEARKHKPAVSDTWIADNTLIDIIGRQYWLLDIIDIETRYLIVTCLSATRTAIDINIILGMAVKRTGKIPKVVITDGWRGYIDGIEMAFKDDLNHAPGMPSVEKDSMNLIELSRGNLADRNKVMRFKKQDTAKLIIEGWLIDYNFFRPNPSLNYRTPAAVAGIQFPHRNWLDVLKSQAPAYYNPMKYPAYSEA